MTASTNTPLIAIIVIPLVIMLVGIFLVLLTRLKGGLKRLEKKAVASVAPQKVLMSTYKANYFGTLSRGVKQLRGNGALVLTEHQLFFSMMMPDRRFSIPLERVVRVETPNSFNYKTVAQPLLAVYFRDDAGNEDGMGFWVPDPAQWAGVVTSAAGLS